MTDQPQAQLRDATEQRRYELTLRGELAGFIDYREHGSTRNLVHTEVQPQFEGQGLGAQLAQFALDQARSSGGKVVPSCSFVAAYVRRHPEYADVVEGAAV